jgi:ribulose bisphosphate carboxylase small subunit
MHKISTAKEALELSIKNGYDLEMIRQQIEQDSWNQVMNQVESAAKKGQVCVHLTFRDDHKNVYMRLIDAGFDPTQMNYIQEGEMYYKGVMYWGPEK